MYIQYISCIFIMLIASRLKIHKFRLLKQCKQAAQLRGYRSISIIIPLSVGKMSWYIMTHKTLTKKGQVQGRQCY